MSAFVGLRRNDVLPDIHLSYNSVHNENSVPLLLDMDTQKNTLMTMRVFHEPVKKEFSIGDYEDIDGSGWFYKPVKDWSMDETASWLMSTASRIGQSYDSIKQTLVIPGKELFALTRKDFLIIDRQYGGELHDSLHSQLPAFGTIYDDYTEEESRESGNTVSDAESGNSVEVRMAKRPVGRPRVSNPKKKGAKGQGKLWEFIRDLLHNRDTCPRLICWEDYSQAKFRFVLSDKVAKLWGSRKENTKMTYEKLSRAMRYYYKNKVFLPVIGRRLVYQFGPNATGWQTDDPNFRRVQ